MSSRTDLLASGSDQLDFLHPAEGSEKDTKTTSLIEAPVGNPRPVFGVETKRPDYRFEALNSDQITPDITRQVADGFREIFASSFKEFLVCQDCSETMSAPEVYGLPPSTFVSLNIMDTIIKRPPCPCCQNPMELFHDPHSTERQLAKKFKQDAHLVLLREADNPQILGVTFGYKASLATVFEREWQNKFIYTAQPNPKRNRDFKLFLEKVIPSLQNDLAKAGKANPQLDMDTEVFCWNCYYLNPQVQFHRLFPQLTIKLARSLPENYAELAVIGETIDGCNSHQFLQLVGGSTVRGVLGDNYVLVTASIHTGRQNLDLLRPRK